MKRTISTDDAPAAVGAYSQATTNGDLLITAGQLPLTVDGELLDDEFNEAYGEFFDEDPPARSAVGAGAVPKGAAVEIEAIATTE